MPRSFRVDMAIFLLKLGGAVLLANAIVFGLFFAMKALLHWHRPLLH